MFEGEEDYSVDSLSPNYSAFRMEMEMENQQVTP